jgi:hypothetical protein
MKDKENKLRCNAASGGAGGALYFVGFLGAVVYYWQQAPTFWDGFIGFLKALVWPAFLVYELFKFLNL